MKVLGVTLARGGSKSVPRKNILQLKGKPLIAYTIEEALKSKLISKYIVSTDDDEIAAVSRRFGADVPFIRPANLASDEASSADALQHAVAWIERHDGVKYDYVVELMCTNPLKTAEDIDGCITKILKTGADSVIAVHRLYDHHPRRIKKIEHDRIVDFCLEEVPESRRQDLTPAAYIRSGSIYCLNRDYLMDMGRRYGSENSRPYVLSDDNVVNIDTELDFLLAEAILEMKGQQDI